MERVAFLLPDQGQWVRCLLNPESLSMTREAGLRSAATNERSLSGPSMRDDPIIITGGGRTDLTLDLLFDVELSQAPVPDHDVRHLSDPIWQLAEQPAENYQTVRLVWGKNWNIPGVITSAAQRFDRFLSNGTPRRNWLRVAFRRIDEEHSLHRSTTVQARQASRPTTVKPGDKNLYLGNQAGPRYVTGSRIDLLAAEHLGDANRWRDIAQLNQLSDPTDVPEGKVWQLPDGAGS